MIIHWTGKTMKILLLYWLWLLDTVSRQMTARDWVCWFWCLIGVLGGEQGGRERQAIQHQHVFAKIKIKTENLQGKVNIPREKICSQSVFEKKAVMTDRGAKTYSSSLGKSCDKGPSVFLKVWQYVHSVFLSHSMQTMQFFLTCWTHDI